MLAKRSLTLILLLANSSGSFECGFVVRSEPFKLTEPDIRRAGLNETDIGSWCLILEGCYHVFQTEAQVLRPYRMSLEGLAVE
ncbi:MAG: hypothetical protein AAF583_14470 [Pseudomonadota bacterium]